MDDEKMQEPKPNKKLEPAENKAQDRDAAANAPTQITVRIKMKPGRAAEGVHPDENGYAFVDKEFARYLVSIQYAEEAEE